MDAAGDGLVLTVRRHKPVQRIRAISVTADGVAGPSVTISDRTHSAAQPSFDVAADGTAVAAWQWHDPQGWRVQAAIRRPGQARFGAPQLLSPPAPRSGRSQPRPWIAVAAGPGGRAALTWQVGGSYELPEAPLHVLSAGPDGRFGADQALPGGGGLADVALAVGPAGDEQLAWLDRHYSGHESSSALRIAGGAAGAPFGPVQVLSRGGRGTSSGPEVAAAFSEDGTATIAWAAPGSSYEDGGRVESFTRAPGGVFGPAQRLGQDGVGLSLAGGPGSSATLGWMRAARTRTSLSWSVHATTRGVAGGAFAPEQEISDPARNALWPSMAMLPSGDALAAWVTNTDGSGGGRVAAARHHAG
jgi:hypothetical protein